MEAETERELKAQLERARKGGIKFVVQVVWIDVFGNEHERVGYFDDYMEAEVFACSLKSTYEKWNLTHTVYINAEAFYR